MFLHRQIQAIVVTRMWQERQILDYFAAPRRQVFDGAITEFAANSQFCQSQDSFLKRVNGLPVKAPGNVSGTRRCDQGVA